MKSFRSTLSEASFLKPDYVAGHKIVFSGDKSTDLVKMGYKKGDVFEIVPIAGEPDVVIGAPGQGEKYLKAPDGKIIHFQGGLSFRSSSFTHLKASGAMPSGAEWEDVIVYAYNEIKGQSTDPETAEVAAKFWPMYSEAAITIANNFIKNLKAKRLVQTGRGIGSITLGPIWRNAGAKNATPKTDIASADFKEKISLKKEGGSQLASAEKKEAVAIVNAALMTMGSDKKFAKGLIDAMEGGMQKLISREATSSLNKRSKYGDSDGAVIDYQTKDKDNKELSQLLSSYINQDTIANATFSRHVVWEAATGNSKFGSPSSKAAANLLGKFSPTGAVQVEDISSPDAPLIQSYATKVRPYVAFKKSGNSPAYAAFRLGLSEHNTFEGIVMSELSRIPGLVLTEDMLVEGPLSYLKSLGAKAKKALKNVFSKVSNALKRIVASGKEMFSKLLNFFGVEVKSATGIVSEVSL